MIPMLPKDKKTLMLPDIGMIKRSYEKLLREHGEDVGKCELAKKCELYNSGNLSLEHRALTCECSKGFVYFGSDNKPKEVCQIKKLLLERENAQDKINEIIKDVKYLKVMME